MFKDRPYQTECLQAIDTEYGKGVNRQVVAMATGTGKTVVFAKLYDKMQKALSGQMVVLAHREELIDQAIDKIRAINPFVKVDKEKAEHHADTVNSDVIVASVATLGRKNTKRMDKFNWDKIDKLITDEAHHSVAQSYLNVYERSGILKDGVNKLLLGVTATPNRADGKALAKIYKKVVYVYGMRSAIEDGWLVDVRGYKVNTKTSLDKVKTVGGDFAQDELANAVNNPERNQLVVKAWLDYAENRQTVVFTVDIQHAKDLAEMFQKYNVKAEAIWGNDPDRADKLKRHKDGDITVLLNCGVLTEGYDDWQIGCILLARPTKSSTLFTQMVGRGTRLQDGTGNLLDWTGGPIKKDCIVIDVVDTTSKHSLITLPTLLGMSAKLDLRGRSMVGSIKQIEDAQKEFSHIDFSNLQDITELKTYVESINLFDIKFPPEVEDNSKLSWHTAADGGLILLLPNKEEVRIKQDLLDKWVISGIIHGKRYKGVRESIEDAFVAADNLIYQQAPEHLKILNRQEKWHDEPATMAQLNLLRKFYKGKPLPNDLNKGKASRLISSFLAGKV